MKGFTIKAMILFSEIIYCIKNWKDNVWDVPIEQLVHCTKVFCMKNPNKCTEKNCEKTGDIK